VRRKYIPICIQQDATLHSLFIPGNCSTCFGWYFHPSSGAQTTVSTASGYRYLPLSWKTWNWFECYSNILVYPTRCNVTQFIYICKLLYMFRVVLPPIIRSACNACTASGICHTVTAICRYRGRVGTGLNVLWVAYATHSTFKPVPTLPR